MKLNLHPAVLLDISSFHTGEVGRGHQHHYTKLDGSPGAGADAEGAWQVLQLEWLTLKGHICSLAGHELFAPSVMKTPLST